MSYLRIKIEKIAVHFILLLLVYTVFRAMFYIFNLNELESLTWSQLPSILKGGFRFDISAIAFLNAIWVLLVLIIPANAKNKLLKFILMFTFLVPNIIAFLFEISDWIYFNFNRKRATFEIFDLIFSKGDFLILLPSYLVKYWFVPIIGIAFIAIIIIGYKKLQNYYAEKYTIFEKLGFKKNNLMYFISFPIVFILIAGCLVLMMRGGLQLVPINARNAVEYLPANQAAVVLNTPFSIITSFESGRLMPRDYMDEEVALKIAQPIKQYHPSDSSWQKKNIVFIIWESLSKRYTGLEDPKTSVTPFLDSLSRVSLTFMNGYANALRSNEGLPSIFSGFPAMMEGPVINSIYSNNSFTSIPSLLRDEGYQTSFFHGGNNGTMSLDTYAENAGFSSYFGRTEYGDDKDYDGAWGIWDIPFLQFSFDQIMKMKEPFCSSVFTLTSHVPFNVPKGFVPTVNHTKDEVERSMNYTDQALKLFFEKASKAPWFQNTIFVLSADHGCPVANDPFYIDGLGRYQIPIIIFDPQKIKNAKEEHHLMQQLDILPTVMDYLGYDKPFFALGNSAFDPIANRFIFNYLSGNYSIIRNNLHLKTNADQFVEAYKFPEDIKDSKNIIDQIKYLSTFNEAEQYTKAFIQVLYNGMINDRLKAKDYK
ncbi:MAG TPA: sulfatase-like hydrolase/transferase [Edaphocola sp.]|nr:sulfatase-like hydrolase/transferase [Edaphocola sp.]